MGRPVHIGGKRLLGRTGEFAQQLQKDTIVQFAKAL